ncbi:uncharacterized protein LOC142234859 [Haematobia irritans]|uniref:uncharacterized protein LOC142234859 n=1 Tax=Haematobia irritans TaxID=7368 RepID=UPI003F4FB6B6
MKLILLITMAVLCTVSAVAATPVAKAQYVHSYGGVYVPTVPRISYPTYATTWGTYPYTYPYGYAYGYSYGYPYAYSYPYATTAVWRK